MPRIARKYFKSKFKHIIVQGINKQSIFENDKYIQKYKEIILNKLKKSNVLILAYCIMNNHTHFLMYSEDSNNISKYMQKVNGAYSQFYNKINERVGYVFRDRYYSQDILTQNQLYNCLRYIHNNPVKANICKNMGQYKYSSYNEFLKKQEIINNKGIVLLFGTDEDYKEEFEEVHKYVQDENFIDVKEKSIEEFISEIEKRYDIKTVRYNKSILKNVIKKARKETDVKIVKLAEILGIGKNTVTKYEKMGKREPSPNP